MKTDKFTPKVQPRGMKVIFKSLKNLRSRPNFKGCSNKNLQKLPQQETQKLPQQETNRESMGSYTPPINDIRAEPTRQMPQRRLFSRARSNLDNSVLSSRQYSMSTVMCPDTTLYSHPQPIFLESDADISLPRLSSTPLTTKIGSPRFASTPTSDKHASIISRIDHVIESSANQCSKIFETGHSVDLRMALEPFFKESCEAAEGMWRPWLWRIWMNEWMISAKTHPIVNDLYIWFYLNNYLIILINTNNIYWPSWYF